MKTELREKMIAIGRRMALQDNRCTADPMFCVQVMERHPVPDGHSDLTGYYDANAAETYYPDRSPEEWGKMDALESEGDDLPDGVESFNYVERWVTKTVCFTEDGCNEHLRVNGHNYREYFGTRIYVESFWRNEEMLAIREFLLAVGNGEVEISNSEGGTHAEESGDPDS